MLHAAREEIKANFRKNSGLEIGSPAATSGIAHAEEVPKILLANIVQGKHQGDNKYSKS